MTLRRLVLWRHGETDYNAGRRMQGHLDSVLTPLGREQAERAAPLITAYEPRLLMTSDLGRAATTAAALAATTGLVPTVDKRLRETHLGQWQGLSHDEVDRLWPGARERWHGDPHWAPPGGESRVAVAARALPVVDELDAGDIDNVVLCAHRGVIVSLVASLLELPPKQWTLFGPMGNCAWSVLERPALDAPWRLMVFNAGLPA